MTTSIDRAGTFIDERFGAARGLRKPLRKAFPDHWSFLLGEMALYSFVILILTGTFLTFFYKPSMAAVVYEGSYEPMAGVRMSEAYASVLHLSFDVRGGLLLRQIHHWAAAIFVVAILCHLLRIFFTGAFRKPRDLTWIIGVLLLAMALAESFFGYSIPADQLSGTGLRIVQSLLLSIPVVGSYLSLLLFGSDFPGDLAIPRMFTTHVLLLPGIMAALVPLHALILTWRQTHTEFPAPDRSENRVKGAPFFPIFMVKTGAMFMFTFAAAGLLGTLVMVNPIWLYGPYNPAVTVPGAQPDWYFAPIEGSLRLVPAWEFVMFGHTVSLGLLLPMLLIALFFLGLAVYPFLERRLTRDTSYHHLLTRPREAPVRTAFGMGLVSFVVILWLAASADSLAAWLGRPLDVTIWVFRVAIVLVPVVIAVFTWRVCQRRRQRDKHARHT